MKIPDQLRSLTVAVKELPAARSLLTLGAVGASALTFAGCDFGMGSNTTYSLSGVNVGGEGVIPKGESSPGHWDYVATSEAANNDFSCGTIIVKQDGKTLQVRPVIRDSWPNQDGTGNSCTLPEDIEQQGVLSSDQTSVYPVPAP